MLWPQQWTQAKYFLEMRFNFSAMPLKDVSPPFGMGPSSWLSDDLVLWF